MSHCCPKAWLALPLGLLLSACGTSPPGKGGGAGTGGVAGAAGGPAVSTTGGNSGTGGTPGAAGATQTGGRTGTAGLSPTGGSGGAGGSHEKPDAGQTGNLTMFYLDVTGGRVMTAGTTTPVTRVLVPSAGQGPDGVAVDVAGGHVYWTGMGVPSANDGFIMRADLDGSHVTTLVPPGGTYTPKQMKLDVAGGKMYWSDREGMRVMRANLDGSKVEALVTTGRTDADRKDESRWCVGVALDLARGYVYWSQKGPANGHVGSLRRASLTMPAGQTSVTRTDVEVLYDELPEPIDIDLDLDAGYIYWTDRAENSVSRAPIEVPPGATAATRTDRKVLVPGVATAIGVALDLTSGKVYYTSGANGALGRANLDGSHDEPLIPMAGNLTGIALGQLR